MAFSQIEIHRVEDGRRGVFHARFERPPLSHGAPRENENAVGNSGGGAPELNFNAGTHGGFSDWKRHYERLAEDDKRRVDERTAGYIDCSRANLPDMVIEGTARELATLSDMWYGTTLNTLDRGPVIEHEKMYDLTEQTYTVYRLNPAFRAEIANSAREFEL